MKRSLALFVTVDSSVWLAEIVRYRRKEILDRLQHSFGKDLIARISFWQKAQFTLNLRPSQ